MKPFRKVPKRIILFSSALVILASVAVGGTLAYLQSTTSQKVNNFVAPIADIQIRENASSFQFDGNLTTKKEVKVQNVKHDDKSIPVYIRVKLVPIWRHAGSTEGTGIPVDLAGLKYGFGNSGTSSLPTDNWVESGGYYYYIKPVQPDAYTDYLIKKVSITSGNQPNCDLEIQVIADSIQADGKIGGVTAAENAWGVNPATLH